MWMFEVLGTWKHGIIKYQLLKALLSNYIHENLPFLSQMQNELSSFVKNYINIFYQDSHLCQIVIKLILFWFTFPLMG